MGVVVDESDDRQDGDDAEDDRDGNGDVGDDGSPGALQRRAYERSTMTQNVNVPTTRAITRLLKGSRKSVWTTRGEYWLDAT